jgi:hypothetical protein
MAMLIAHNVILSNSHENLAREFLGKQWQNQRIIPRRFALSAASVAMA